MQQEKGSSPSPLRCAPLTPGFLLVMGAQRTGGTEGTGSKKSPLPPLPEPTSRRYHRSPPVTVSAGILPELPRHARYTYGLHFIYVYVCRGTNHFRKGGSHRPCRPETSVPRQSLVEIRLHPHAEVHASLWNSWVVFH